MQSVFFVLNKIDVLDDLLEKLYKGRFSGTILDSKGMARELMAHNEFSFGGALSTLLNPDYKGSKTLFFVVEDDRLDDLIEAIESIVGSLEKQDTGILFATPITKVVGLKKR